MPSAEEWKQRLNLDELPDDRVWVIEERYPNGDRAILTVRSSLSKAEGYIKAYIANHREPSKLPGQNWPYKPIKNVSASFRRDALEYADKGRGYRIVAYPMAFE